MFSVHTAMHRNAICNDHRYDKNNDVAVYTVNNSGSISHQRRIKGWRGEARGHGPPIITYFFSKVRFLMSFQIFLDSIIDLSNETITFIMPCILCSFIRSLNSQ